MLGLLKLGALLVLMGAGACVPAQEENQPPPPEPGYQFVSGTVLELPPGKIVVHRAVLGKPAETRTFTISPETKIEGKLRTRIRVTVGFQASEEGELVAVRIIVRPSQPPKK